MDCSTPGFPVLLLEFAQTHVLWADDAIQPSHSLLPPSPPALNLSSIQVFLVSQLSASGGQSMLVSDTESVLPIVKVNFFHDWQVWSPCSLRDSQESSPAPQFESINYSMLCLLYCPTLSFVHEYWKNHSFDYMELCQQWCLCFLIRCQVLS